MRPSSLLRGAHAYLTPTAALAGLPAAHANRKAAPRARIRLPRSSPTWRSGRTGSWIGVTASSSPMPAPAARGWPPVREGDWETVLDRFERGFDRALALADDDDAINSIRDPAIEFEPLARYTVGRRPDPPRAPQRASRRPGDYAATASRHVAAAGRKLDVVTRQ